MAKTRKNESTLAQHKKIKKELIPPLLTVGNLKPASWLNERMPEMLWAVLIIGNIDRQRALDFFRYVAQYVKLHPHCWDVTLSGIGKLSCEERIGFISHITSHSEEARSILSSLLLFPEVPAREEWSAGLGGVIPEDAEGLVKGVSETSWHQSQAATDCRWIKFLCRICGDKVRFSTNIPHIQETVRGVLEYPNYGDLAHIRPFIRASEINSLASAEGPSQWAKHFWNHCFEHTSCLPEEAVNKKFESLQEAFAWEADAARKDRVEQTAEVRRKLIQHALETAETTAVDPRHEAAFGLALYGLSLFIETVFYTTPFSITGRLTMRALVETYITFKYLLNREQQDPTIWDTHRVYGSGQLKLVYLKLKEMGAQTAGIDSDEMEHLANEDAWVEFVPINLGHWDAENLRKMSEDVGLKHVYDRFYGYTSGFMHANWGAIRESSYQRCLNPLHRMHRLPVLDLPLMPSITDDAREITNSILECIATAYPAFEPRLIKPPAVQNDPKRPGDEIEKQGAVALT